MVTVSPLFWMNEEQSKEFTSLIKRSIQYQAKYGITSRSGRTCAPSHVVPHPKNRGGVPCGNLRTRQISGLIVHHGFDVIDANQNAVAVEVNPDAPDSFREKFEAAIEGDKMMAKKISNIVASLDSLTHSHLNCLCRNILVGTQGCECAAVADKKKKCRCWQDRVLDADGNYCIDKVVAFDDDWYKLIHTGPLDHHELENGC